MFDNVDVKRLLGRKDDEDEGGGEETEASGLIGKAEAILDVIDPYGAPSPEREPEKDETPIQRQQRLIDRRASLERRRAKAELLAEALKAFVLEADAEPHREGPHE